MGGTSDVRQSLSSVESYDPERNVWSPVADLSVPRYGAGVGVVSGVMYCVGGQTSIGSYTNTVEKYCEETNTWSQVAEINQTSFKHEVITHEGRLYAVGVNSSIEMYDPVTNTWTLLADKAEIKFGSAVALTYKPRT